VGGGVIRKYGRGHENDSIDQFRLLEVRHRFPAAEEFSAVEAVAFMQGGRQCNGKILHEGNSKFRLSRVLLGWLHFAGLLWAQTPRYLDLRGDSRRSPNDDVWLALTATDAFAKGNRFVVFSAQKWPRPGARTTTSPW